MVGQNDDPNYFERIFSSVADTREIKFSYGDMSMPSFIYRDEVAMITNIKPSLNLSSNTITYTLTAVSTGVLSKMKSIAFNNEYRGSSRELIRNILNKLV